MSSSDSIPPSSSPSTASLETEDSDDLSSFFLQKQPFEKARRRKHYDKPKTLPRDPPYTYASTIVEDHGKIIYAVKFCQFIENETIFATVGGPQVTVYRCTDTQIEPITVFKDPQADEEFYAVEWVLCHIQGEPQIFLIFGGKGHLIRTINPFKGTTMCTLIGHGDAINALSTNPKVNSIMASASKDLTVRIWHCLTSTSLAILGGFAGHRDQILTVDFHESGKYVASGSMDHTVRVWNIDSDKNIRDRIARASTNRCLDNLEPVEIHFSDAESRDLHTNYVDSVQFVGSYIFSKSSENYMCLSKFGEFDDSRPCGHGVRDSKPETLSQLVAKMLLPNCDMWFIKFGITTGPPGKAWIACGNQRGVVHMWDLHDRPIPEKSRYQLTDSHFPQTIRKVEFSPDGKIMILVGEGGKICRCNKRIDRKRQQSSYSNKSDDNTQTSGSSLRESSSEYDL